MSTRQILVRVPRTAIREYGGEPWASVVTRAEAGELGASVIDWTSQKPDPEFAHLRECDSRAFLYWQNW